MTFVLSLAHVFIYLSCQVVLAIDPPEKKLSYVNDLSACFTLLVFFIASFHLPSHEDLDFTTL